MSSSELITTANVAARLGISRQAVVDRVHRNALTAAHKIPTANGAYLFDSDYIEEVAAASIASAS
jgi:hypothetical protein